MATIEDAGAARPTGIQVRIIEGRPFVTDFPFRLKSGAAWPSAPVLAFAGPSGTIQWPSTLSDGGKLATVTATKAEVDTLLDHSLRGSVELNDPSTGRMWASGSYFTVLANWTGGTNPAALADGAVVVDDRLVIMGTGDGSGTITSIAWTEVTGKPSSYPPSPHSHTATDLSGVVKTVNGTAPDGSGNVTVSGGGGGSGSTFTVTDTPTAPADGSAASFWVTSAVTWPAGLVWSTDPDGGTEPTITGRALVTLLTVDGLTHAVLGSTFPTPPDTTAPAWPATLTTGTPAETSVVVAASALATDAVGVTGYERSLDSGSTWAAITPSGLDFTLTGLTASTAYPAPQFRAKDAAGNYSAVLAAQGFTTAAPPADTTAPTPGTLASSSITSSGFTLTVIGASDAGAGLHSTPYRFSTDNGTTWTAWQTAASYGATGLAAEATYTCLHEVRDAAGNTAQGASITASTTAAPTGLADAILALSPAGYWKLDETTGTTATDSSGNARHGTYSGSLHTLAGQDGYWSIANSPDARVTIADQDDFSIGASGLTVAAIVRRGAELTVLSKTGNGFEWRMTAGGIGCWSPSGDNTPAYANASAAPVDTWVMQCWTIPDPQQQTSTIYRNGVALTIDRNSAGTAIYAAGNSPLRIGAWHADNISNTGAIGHVAIFASTLTAQQVADLHAAAVADPAVPVSA